MKYDVVVVGLGIIGTSIAYHLARRGQHTLGLDSGPLPNPAASSFGESRMIRRTYTDLPAYAPYADQAYAGWKELELLTQKHLLLKTGGLIVSEQNTVGHLADFATTHGIEYQLLSEGDLKTKAPALRFLSREIGFWEPGAGILKAEDCLHAYHEAAIRAGAEIRRNTPVEVDRGGVRMNGEPISTSRIVFALGKEARHFHPQLQAERTVAYWFHPKEPSSFRPNAFPFTILDRDSEPLCVIPDLGNGVKVALHHTGIPAEPFLPPSADEIVKITAKAQSASPSLGPLNRWQVNHYTNAPRQRFLCERLSDKVWSVSACSGHGFKFAPVVGREVAESVTSSTSPAATIDIFRLLT